MPYSQKVQIQQQSLSSLPPLPRPQAPVPCIPDHHTLDCACSHLHARKKISSVQILVLALFFIGGVVAATNGYAGFAVACFVGFACFCLYLYRKHKSQPSSVIVVKNQLGHEITLD